MQQVYKFITKLKIVSGDLRGIHQSTVSRIITSVSNVIAGKLKHYVKFPEINENEQWENVKLRYNEIGKMTGVGDYIYVYVYRWVQTAYLHIKIQNPGELHEEVLRNRKG